MILAGKDGYHNKDTFFINGLKYEGNPYKKEYFKI